MSNPMRIRVLLPACVLIALVTSASGTSTSTDSLPTDSFIALWAGAPATIPDGWQTVGELDDRFVRSTAPGEDPGTTGGGTHAHSCAEIVASVQAVPYEEQIIQGYGMSFAGNYHTHAASIPTHVSGAASPLPEHVRLAHLAAQDLSQVPPGLIALWSGDAGSIPAGWALCDGDGGRPDLRDRFVCGTANDETPGTVVASTLDHHHAHGPFTTSTGPGLGSTVSGQMQFEDMATSAHSHELQIPAFDSSTTSAAPPPYHELAFIRYEGGTPAPPPTGLIVMWSGPANAIPDGWAECDGIDGRPALQDRFIRGARADEATGATGGGGTHDHVVGPLSLLTDPTSDLVPTQPWYSGPSAISGNHQHPVSVPATTTAAAQALPPYVELTFIAYQSDLADAGDLACGRTPSLAIDEIVPNPFNPLTHVHFDLQTPQTVTLRIHDLSGRCVRTLIDAVSLADGPHERIWRGRDDAGRALPSGAYFLRLSGKGESDVRKVMLLR